MRAILRKPTRRTGGRWMMAGLFVLAAPLQAQYVDMRANLGQPQDGRLFDANPSLTGGRYNSSLRPTSPLVNGNAFAEGNVSRGLSLQARSPIGNPNSFMGPLGSGSLSTFRRDSVSVADTADPLALGFYSRPYYDTSTTVPNAGFLQGFAGLTRTRPRTDKSPGLEMPERYTDQPGLYTRATPLEASVVPLPGATVSSIFGPQLDPRLMPPKDNVKAWETVPRLPVKPKPTPEGDARPEQRALMEDESRTPLERLLRGESLALQPGLAESEAETGIGATNLRQPAIGKVGLVLPPVSTADRAAPAGAIQPRLVDASVLPGHDVFTDMRLALALVQDPGASWFNEMRAAALARSELARDSADEANLDRDQFMDRMLRAPLRTLTGGGATALNDLMLKAESLMGIGHYYEAADRYGAAQSLDPTNPLPLLGRGHALLAAGEYRSAALALTQGLDRFPDIARFTYDLKQLMGGGEAIDIRRADLMRRIQQRESAELLFLLGYIEYHTGDHTRGLADLERAARADRTGSVISRYPAMLRGEGTLPPPQLPELRPPARAPGRSPASPLEPEPNPRETLRIPPPVDEPPPARP